jgi:hypothetical protein
MVSHLHRLLLELIPGGAKEDLSAARMPRHGWEESDHAKRPANPQETSAERNRAARSSMLANQDATASSATRRW